MLKLKPSLEDLVKSSVRSILKNKGRTILTSLGIIIGVTSVILLTSIGNGLKVYINDQFDKLGSNLIYIVPGRIFNEGGGFANQNSLPTKLFSEKDVRKFERRLSNAVVIPASESPQQFKYQSEKTGGNLVGTTTDFGKYRNMLPSEGNGYWFTPEENSRSANVAVLGFEVADKLFGSKDPLGKTITASGRSLKVIGVVDKKGGTMGGPNLDSYVYVPLSTFNDIVGKNDVQSISVRVNSGDLIASTKREAKRLMLEDYDADEFTVFDSAQILSSINSIIGIMTVALTGIAAISLVVGGIGIMNIMLVTVSERTKEIGLRKAIGAYPRAILLQFLIEAIFLSGLGGLVGILLGALGTAAINNFFPARITLSSIALAFGVSFLVGVIFGVTPAQKAAKLSPIEALRYE